MSPNLNRSNFIIPAVVVSLLLFGCQNSPNHPEEPRAPENKVAESVPVAPPTLPNQPEAAKPIHSIYGNKPPSSIELSVTHRLEPLAGFQQLRPDEKDRLLKYVCGDNAYISEPARQSLEDILPPQAQIAATPDTFREFMKNQPSQTGSLYAREIPLYTSPTLFKQMKPISLPNHGFRSENMDAALYYLSVNSRVISIYQPVKAGQSLGSLHTPSAVAMAIGHLPPYSLHVINSVTVEPHEDPDDSVNSREHPGFGGAYMSAGAVGDVSVYPHSSDENWKNFVQCMVHESGHALSMRTWGSEATGVRWKYWKDAIASDGLSPSAYAKTSIFEDFAETLLLYFLCKGQPEEPEIKAIFPARLAIMERMVATTRPQPKTK